MQYIRKQWSGYVQLLLAARVLSTVFAIMSQFVQLAKYALKTHFSFLITVSSLSHIKCSGCKDYTISCIAMVDLKSPQDLIKYNYVENLPYTRDTK